MGKHGKYRSLVSGAGKGLAAALTVLVAGPASAQACSLALILGLDVSGSVDAREYQQQIDGVGRALLSDEVRTTMLAHGGLPVAILVYEWSDSNAQSLIADWTIIDSEAPLEALGLRVLSHRRTLAPDATSIGSAMLFAAEQFARGPDCLRRTLDVSGDGKNNAAPAPEHARDAPGLAAVTINGLVIGADAPATGDSRLVEIGELVAYYQSRVINGPGAFVETAFGFDDYEAAMIRKLLRELPALSVGALDPAERPPEGGGRRSDQ